MAKTKKHPIQVEQSENGEWFYRVVGKNGRTLVHSENMKRKAGVLNSIEALTQVFREILETVGVIGEIEPNQATKEQGKKPSK